MVKILIILEPHGSHSMASSIDGRLSASIIWMPHPALGRLNHHTR
jgi:hypothetical protein